MLLLTVLFAACTKEEPVERAGTRTTENHRVSVEEALDELNAVLSFTDPQTRGRDSRRVGTVEPVVSYKSGATRSMSAADTLMYLVNFDNEQGFAFLGADDRIDGVLALIDAGSLSMDDYLSKSYLEDLGTDFDIFGSVEAYAKKGVQTPAYGVPAMAAATKKYYGEWIPEIFNEPFLTTSWHQGTPFNDLCPVKNGKRSPAGCVAIALAQIITYNKMRSGKGPNSLEGYSFDWNSIINGAYTDTESFNREVAKLVRAIGKAVGMDYGAEESSSNTTKAMWGLYLAGYISLEANNYADKYVQGMIRNKKKPVYARGSSLKTATTESGGHAWVIDGYNTYHRNVYDRDPFLNPGLANFIGTEKKTMVHCNFGWLGYIAGEAVKGWANGYYISGVFDTSKGAEIADHHFGDGPFGKEESAYNFLGKQQVVTYDLQ